MVEQSSLRRSLNTGCTYYIVKRTPKRKKCTLLILLYFLPIYPQSRHWWQIYFSSRFFITNYYLYYVLVYAYDLKVNKVRKLILRKFQQFKFLISLENCHNSVTWSNNNNNRYTKAWKNNKIRCLDYYLFKTKMYKYYRYFI